MKLKMILQNIEQFVVQDEENQTAYLKLPAGGWWYWSNTRWAGPIRADVEAGRYDQADLRVAEWLQSEPDNPEAYYWLARLHVAQNRPKEALQAAQTARRLGYPDRALEPLIGIVRRGD